MLKFLMNLGLATLAFLFFVVAFLIATMFTGNTLVGLIIAMIIIASMYITYQRHKSQ